MRKSGTKYTLQYGRTDAKIDNKKVLCKNTSNFGFTQGIWCKRDMIVMYHEYEGGPLQLGRALGRVTALCDEGENPTRKVEKSFILVMQLADDAHFCYERWIDPDLVRRLCVNPVKFVEFFFGDNEVWNDPHMMRRLSSHGT